MDEKPTVAAKPGEQAPALFRYGLSPVSLPYTDNPANPSKVTLMITVVNPTMRNVECSRLVFSIPTGAGVSDLIAEGWADYVEARPVVGTPWGIVGDGVGNFTATPDGNVTGLGPGDGIAFEFERVRVNDLPGPAPIIVWEETDQLREGYVSPDPVKVPPRLSITRFTASPIQVVPRGSVQLKWETYGAESVLLGWNGTSIHVPNQGGHEVNPAANTKYHLTAYGQGTSVSAVIEVLVTKVTILDFGTDEPAVPQGGPATLRWAIANAAEALIDDELVSPTEGVKLVTPSAPTIYYLSAFGPTGGSDAKPARVNVKRVSIVYFTPESAFIRAGEPVTLDWKTEWSIGTSIVPGVGPVPGVGTTVVAPRNDTTYELIAQGYEGPIKREAKITVESVAIEPFSVEPKSIAPGESATLRWQTRNADSVSLAPSVGPVARSGEHQVTPDESTTYTLTAFGPNGPAIGRVSLDVRSVRFTAAWGEHLSYDNSAVIHWNTQYCNYVDLRQPNGTWITNKPAQGKYVFGTPRDDERWVLRAYGAGKSPIDTVVYLGGGPSKAGKFAAD